MTSRPQIWKTFCLILKYITSHIMHQLFLMFFKINLIIGRRVMVRMVLLVMTKMVEFQVTASVFTLLAIALERHRAVITLLAPRCFFTQSILRCFFYSICFKIFFLPKSMSTWRTEWCFWDLALANSKSFGVGDNSIVADSLATAVLYFGNRLEFYNQSLAGDLEPFRNIKNK